MGGAAFISTRFRGAVARSGKPPFFGEPGDSLQRSWNSLEKKTWEVYCTLLTGKRDCSDLKLFSVVFFFKL